MSTYTMQLRWQRQGAAFTDNRYSRAHTWHFDGGVLVPASSSPHVVPIPYSDPTNVDPEEAYVAALASCHMLTFLWLVAQRGFVVEAYDEHPVDRMGPNAQGRECITQVMLHPHVVWGAGASVNESTVTQLHHQAHAQCYLANSVTTHINVQGSWEQWQGNRAFR